MKDDKEKALEISKIDLQIQEAENIALQQKLDAAQKIANIDNAAIAVRKTALKVLEKQVGFEQKITAIRLEREAIARGQKKADPISILIAEIQAEENKKKIAKEKAEIELASAKVQRALLEAQIKALVSTGNMNPFDGFRAVEDLDDAFDGLEGQLLKEINNVEATAVPALEKAFAKAFGGDLVSKNLSKGIMTAFLTSEGAIKTLDQQLIVAGSSLKDFGQTMVDTFGENGAVVGALSNFSASMVEFGPKLAQSFAAIDAATGPHTIMGADGSKIAVEGLSLYSSGLLKTAAKAEMVGSVIGQMGALMKADSDRRIAMVDQNIEAEKRLDGKSAGSLAKIAAMEKKKENLQRKSFETQKKIQMAQVIASTAASVMQTMAASGVGFFATPLAMVVAAMGAAQLAIIKKTQFNGGGGDTPAVANTAINIGGKRSNKVDVSQGASSGETAFLRGGQGVGSSANNFIPGGAMGRKGYANGGDSIVVGERGPEVISPASPVDITPNYELGGGKNMNITFNVNAVDAQSVQELLTNNQGAVVGAIRNAANSYGQDFLPDVNVGYVER